MALDSCKALTTDPEQGTVQEYFALIHWHDDSSRQFDISITDCSSAWSAAGCIAKHNAHNVSEEEGWMRTKEALSDAGSATQYRYWTTFQAAAGTAGSQLVLNLAWDLGAFQGMEVMVVHPALEQQADASSAIRRIMSHMMASYSTLKAAGGESMLAQQQLERSLADKESLLKQKILAGQEQEKVMFTKFAMLLNKKTARIQQLTDRLQQSEQQLERLRGSDDRDTDDEAREAEYGAAAAYEAETEDDSDEEQPHTDGKQELQQQQQHQAELPAAATGGDARSLGQYGGAAGTSSAAGARAAGLGVQPQPEVEEAEPAAAADQAAALPADMMDTDVTLPLDDDALQALDMQRQLHQQRQQQSLQPAGVGTACAADPFAVVQQAAGSTAGTGALDPAAAAAGGVAGLGWGSVGAAAVQGEPGAETTKKKVYKRIRS